MGSEFVKMALLRRVPGDNPSKWIKITNGVYANAAMFSRGSAFQAGLYRRTLAPVPNDFTRRFRCNNAPSGLRSVARAVAGGSSCLNKLRPSR